MDELTKQVLATFFPNDGNSQIALELKDILKKTDKELYYRVRGGNLTIRQLKARALEKANGNRFECIVLDDIRDKVAEEYLNLDHKKVDEYLKAAFNQGLDQIKPDGPDGILNDNEQWQYNMRCLRSLKNYGVKKPRASTARTGRSGWSGSGKTTIPRETNYLERTVHCASTEPVVARSELRSGPMMKI